MAPPVDDFRGDDAERERDADDDEGAGPPEPPFFVGVLISVGRSESCGPEGAFGASPGARSVGDSPLIRFLIKAGFSLRRKTASSASSSASLALTPPWPARRWDAA